MHAVISARSRFAVLARPLAVALLAASVFAGAVPASAANKTWSGTTDGNWNNGTANWNGSAIPVNNDVVIFSTSGAGNLATTNNIASLSLNGITVNGNPSAAISIAGNAFTINNAAGIDMTAASQNLSINVGLTASTSQTWDVASGKTLTIGSTLDLTTNNTVVTVQGAGNTVITGAITLNGTNQGLIKTGTGTLTINGTSATNAYKGSTTVNGGTLLVNGRIGDNSPATTTTVATTSSATLGGTGTVDGTVTINGTVTAGTTTTIGKLGIGKDFILSATANYHWDLGALKDDATGTAGTDFDQIVLTQGNGGQVTVTTGSSVTVSFENGIGNPTSGNTFWNSSHTWTIIATPNNNNGTGPSVTNATFSTGTFSTTITTGQIRLLWTPTPEASHVLLAALAGLAVVGYARRRFSAAVPATMS